MDTYLQRWYKYNEVIFRKLLEKKVKTLDKRSKNKKQSLTNRQTIRSLSFINPIYPSIIIFTGLIIFSGTVIFLTKQFQPLIENQRLKLLCTYQLGDKKSNFYKPAKIKLEKLSGDGEKFCKNFIFPKEKNKKKFQFLPILRNIIFRLI